MKLNLKLKTSAKVYNMQDNSQLEPLEIESGAFEDIPHYSGMSTAALYEILLYGTKGGRIPPRDVLAFMNAFMESNVDTLARMYIENISGGSDTVGHAVGSYINSQHQKYIYGFASPHNAPSTVKQKGFDDPLVDSGALAESIFYSINGNGRYK